MSDVATGAIAGLSKPVTRLLYGTARKEIMDAGSDAIRLLDEIFECGITSFDTARVYGAAERALGRWMRARRNSDSVVIVSKGVHPRGSRTRVNPAAIRTDLHRSLKLLGVERIDLYLLHRDDESVPVGPLVEELNASHAAGKIASFGASNWSHTRIQEANTYARDHGLLPFVVSSPNFGLAEEAVDPWGGGLSISGPAHADARAWYAASGMPVLAWSSLGRGFFSGRVHSDDPASAASVLDAPARTAFLHPSNLERLRRAETIAQSKGCTVPQLALAWVLSQRPMDVFAVVTASSAVRMKQNIAALEIELTDAEVAYLDLRDAS